MTEEKKIEGAFTLELSGGGGCNETQGDRYISERLGIVGKPFIQTFTEPTNNISFHAGREVIKLCGNGDVYIRGELMENNKQLLDAMKAWLMQCNLYHEGI
jgi:hypothetical protein